MRNCRSRGGGRLEGGRAGRAFGKRKAGRLDGAGVRGIAREAERSSRRRKRKNMRTRWSKKNRKNGRSMGRKR